jgi:hypothetical protein
MLPAVDILGTAVKIKLISEEFVAYWDMRLAVRSLHAQEEEGEEGDDELRDRTTAPVPKWEVLAAGDRAVWVQLCQQLRLDQGSLG